MINKVFELNNIERSIYYSITAFKVIENIMPGKYDLDDKNHHQKCLDWFKENRNDVFLTF